MTSTDGKDASAADESFESKESPIPRLDSVASIDRTDERAAALPSGTTDPVFEAKAQVLNNHIQKIGMGKYQWLLFGVVGFGWASDNLWPITTSLIFTPVANEFSPTKPPLLSLSQNIGLLFGAAFWGFGCDIWGRKWAFNLTLGTTAFFGLLAASSPNFAAIGCFAALWSTGVGGNLPVDSAIFLEFLPATHQYLLTVLSVFWALAQVMATLIAWPLLGNLTCQEDTVCTRGENMGWRYFLITVGGIWVILFIMRFMFPLFESPKYLMGRGRDEDAVLAVHEVARRNGTTTDICLADLTIYNVAGEQGTSAIEILNRRLERLNLTHVRALFATPKLAYSTSLIMLVWAFIGLGFPLYNVGPQACFLLTLLI
jgi:MFS family permease